MLGQKMWVQQKEVRAESKPVDDGCSPVKDPILLLSKINFLHIRMKYRYLTTNDVQYTK
jgi:hypothetical protein